jgi:O-antigen/teichoic acid export membrane protein
VIERVVTYAAMFISVPLILHYLGPDTYGVILAMTSVATLFASLDLGIPQGLTGLVAEAHGRDDRASVAVFVASAFYLSLAIVVALIVAGFGVTAFGLFAFAGLDNVTREGAPTVLAVIGVCLLLGVPLGLAASIRIGYQESFLSQGWSMLGALVGLLAVFLAVRTKGGVIAVLLASFGIPLAASAANSAFLFLRSRVYLLPRVADIRIQAVRTLLKSGLPFFALQLATAISIWTDEIVIALVFGAATVPGYSIPARIFNLVPLAVGLVVTPLWPAYREAIARGDRQWVAKAFTLSTSLSIVVAGVGAGLLLWFHSFLIYMWVGPAVEEAPGVAWGLAVWAVVVSYSSSLVMFHQGLNRLGTQAAWGLLAGIVALIFKVVGAIEVGLWGVIWARTLAYAVLFAVPLSIQAVKTMRAWGPDRMSIEEGRMALRNSRI